VIKLRTVILAVFTALLIVTFTVPEAASNLYYWSQQQLKSYQQLNQYRISKGQEPYTLVQKPTAKTCASPSTGVPTNLHSGATANRN
jgi:hypothetical protein